MSSNKSIRDGFSALNTSTVDVSKLPSTSPANAIDSSTTSVSNKDHVVSLSKHTNGRLLLSIQSKDKSYDKYTYADVILTKKQLKELTILWM